MLKSTLYTFAKYILSQRAFAVVVKGKMVVVV